jgi:hypothetical protein
MRAIRHLKAVAPASEKCTVALPVRKPNAAYRSREHLTEREVERLVEAAKDNRWGHRDVVAAAMSQHVRVDLDVEASRAGRAFHHGLEAAF